MSIDNDASGDKNLADSSGLDKSNNTVDSSTTATTNEANWFLGDNVPGTGNAPDWFDGNSFKSVSEQAEAFKKARDLLESERGKHAEALEKVSKDSKVYGKYFGSPENYDLEKLGLSNFPESDKLLKFAKESNLSENFVGNLVKLYDEITEPPKIDAITEDLKLGQTLLPKRDALREKVNTLTNNDAKYMLAGLLESADGAKALINLLDDLDSGSKGTGTSDEILINDKSSNSGDKTMTDDYEHLTSEFLNSIPEEQRDVVKMLSEHENMRATKSMSPSAVGNMMRQKRMLGKDIIKAGKELHSRHGKRWF